jgi:hypothetical protein
LKSKNFPDFLHGFSHFTNHSIAARSDSGFT